MQPDIIFVASDERETEQNWARLREFAPHSIRVDHQRSINAAYRICAEVSSTDFFFIVDGDNWILGDEPFWIGFRPNPKEIAVWRARNPINGLVYGHGAIKLVPKAFMLRSIEATDVDVATSVLPWYRKVETLASEHRFNSSPFSTWRTAFRECVKLSSGIIKNSNSDESDRRLRIWCLPTPVLPKNGEWCYLGANQGRSYGNEFLNDTNKLRQINDFDWLRDRFLELHPTTPQRISHERNC